MHSKFLIILYRILFSLLRLLSRMPLGVHYFFADWLLYPIAYHLVRYRRKLVNRQLADCFPEKSEKERNAITRRFYHFFCDCIVETLKLATMPHDEVKRRVEFVGIEEMQQTLKQAGKKFGFFYLGHYGNWEWMASFPMWLEPQWQGAQIYHPLYNAEADRFFLHLREQFGGLCIPMKQTMRQILEARQKGQAEIIGFIADQSPKWQATHHWTPFLHHQTAFFIGSERIARQVDAALYYVRVTRPRRGYYRAELVLITLNPQSPDLDIQSEYPATDSYTQLLEQQIREQPELWLWTHNRWKRTYEQWLERNKK